MDTARYRRWGCWSLLMLLPCLAMGFGLDDVAERARVLAQSDFEAPEPVPDFLRELTPEQHRAIRFDPARSLWHDDRSRFQVMMIPPGSYYSHAVRLNVVDGERQDPIPFRRDDFAYPDDELRNRIPADLGYAGFTLTDTKPASGERAAVLMFGGASYFRGAGRDQEFGLSGRGVAIDTGLASGEEFPTFTEFWLERPGPDAEAITIYALLEGESITGAYRFALRPGETSAVTVTARLFLRDAVEQLGLAPLTSMFFYAENAAKPMGQWRPEVHDSDGLLIHDRGSGEWLWRPLVNPGKLQLSYHQVAELGGFGLMQRDRVFQSYEDPEARYDRRPSAWVEPEGDWRAGHVVLVALPTEAETNDNIVAFWVSEQRAEPDQVRELSYRVSFGPPSIPGQRLGRAVPTFFGHSNGAGEQANALRFVVDFEGEELAALAPDAPVVSTVVGGEGTEVLEHFVQFIEPKAMWRLSILARPAPGKILALRAFLSLEGKPVSETWIYEYGAGNGSRRQSD